MNKTKYDYRFHPGFLFVCISLLLITRSAVFAQSASVQGMVMDNQSDPMGFASVVILKQADSSQVAFNLTSEDGKFKFNSIKSGSYIAQVLFMGYGLQSQKFTTDGVNDITLKTFVLEESGVTLKEALIQAKSIPMVFKGDTVVYNPNAFQTKSNATVEDLLKKLPGVQVDKTGTVTAQGEEVVKVLVNGKEFFGNDPTKATQNLDASSIEKVEVLDKKSDASEFTGVDDGTREKVINLVLKEDANKGYFGKVEAGYGTEETYRGKTTLNLFRKENQFTFIGNINNLNQNGFSWQEYYRMLNGSNSINLGQNTYWWSQNEWMGNNQEGRQENAVMGTNAHVKIGKGELDASYFAMRRTNDLQSTTTSENYLPNSVIFSDQQYDLDSRNRQHRGTFKYTLKPDTLNFFTLQGQADYSGGESNVTSYNRNETEAFKLLNASSMRTGKANTNLNLKGELNYTRKFKKNRNYLSLNSGAEVNNTTDTTQWANRLQYSELPANWMVPYQFADNIVGSGQVFFNKAAFTFAVKKNSFLTAAVSNKTAFDRFNQIRNNEVFDSIIGNQSPDMEVDNITNKATLQYMRTSKESPWYISGTVELAQLSSTRSVDRSTDQDFAITKTFILPKMYVSYRAPKKGRIGIWADASEMFPTSSNLNPTADIANPIRISFGTLDLDPYVNYSVGMHTNIRDNKHKVYYYANVNAGVSPNSVYSVEQRTEDNISTTTFVNGEQTKWLNTNANVTLPIEKLKLSIQLSGGYNNYNYFSGLNDVLYQNASNTFNGGVNLSFDFTKLEFSLFYDPSLTVQDVGFLDEPNRYTRQEYGVDVSYNITKRLKVNSEFEVFYFNSLNIGQKQIVPLLNSSIEYALDSNDRWIIGIDGFDLLNKNQAIDRNFFGNSFSETRQNTLTRYMMFHLIYSIKKGKKKEERHGRHW
jgi:hypothetical protein